MSPDVKFLSSRFHGVNSQFPLTSQWLCHQRLSTQIEKDYRIFCLFSCRQIRTTLESKRA